MKPAEQLSRGLTALGLDCAPAVQEKLLAYAALLQKWNKVHNLTAVREESQVVSHHLLDSLAVLPHVKAAKRLADIGSGGGLPGIPLAIVLPAMHVALVESNNKKAAFLQQAKIELQLANVSVHAERVEAWQPPEKFDAVISRAFSDLAEFVRLAGHLVAEGGAQGGAEVGAQGGLLLAMKGVMPYEEIAQLPPPWRVRETLALQVPAVDAQRHLLLIERA